MSDLFGVVIGAVFGIAGVISGTWLQARKEHVRWMRDQKLHASVDFISATGDLFESPNVSGEERVELWKRVQDARSVLYLLCDDDTVDAAEHVLRGIKARTSGTDDDASIDALRHLVSRLRSELGASGH